MTDPRQEFDAFYRENMPRVRGYLRKKCPSEKDAEDLTSIVFTYCFEHWLDYDPGKASRVTWVYMIARSRWINFCRDRKSYVDLDTISEYVPDRLDPIEQAVRTESIRAGLADALRLLPEQQRRAVVLRYFGGMSDERLAYELKTTPGNVRVMICRALKKLQNKMDTALLEG